SKRTLPGLQSEQFLYDEMGNLTNHTDFNQKQTTFLYDELGRLTNKIPDATFNVDPVVFTYFPTGERASMSYPINAGQGTGLNHSETVIYEYQSGGRLWKKITPQGTITYTYD